MTVAALGAQVLDACLQIQAGKIDGLGIRFQHELAQINQTPWLMATSADFLYPGTEGEQPGASTRLTHAYMFQVGKLAMTDRFTHTTLIEVTHLLKPPSALLHPRIATGVLMHLAHSSNESTQPTMRSNIQPSEARR
jgi:hypothetical protein